MFNSDYDRMWSPTKEGQRKSKPKVDIHEVRFPETFHVQSGPKNGATDS